MIRYLLNGRVDLPEAVRAALQLIPGDRLSMVQTGDSLVLTRVTPPPALTAPHRHRPARLLPFRRWAAPAAD